jgi:LmbE family N-acetylglucosaminyl deacetylase
MTIVQPPSARSILAIAAHPDDVESWCAGTLARCADAGMIVRLLLATAGDKGSDDPAADPADVARVRVAEARAGALILGLASVECLGLPDGDVEDTRALRGALARAIRHRRPDVVFTHDPERPLPPYLVHRDHRIVGRAALDAIYPLARDPLSFREHREEGLAHHAVGSVWLFASAAADRFVDISATLERKIEARLAHASQTKDPLALRAGWRRRFAEVGAPVGLAYAEAFTVLDLD